VSGDDRRQLVVAPPAALTEILAERFAREAARAFAERGTMCVALSGGSVARTFFPRLAALDLDWSRLRFFWADERAVPRDDEQSNVRLARELWLAPARVPESSVHAMPADAVDLEGAAAAYAAELAAAAGSPPQLDVALLGMGEDGHVASLFPDSPLVDERSKTVVVVRDAPKPPPVRMSLTLPVLAGARLVVLAAFGAGKAAAIGEAFSDRSSDLPVSRLLREAGRPLVLLDEDAARGLVRRPA